VSSPLTRAARVAETQFVAPRLIRIALEGPDVMAMRPYIPGQEIAVDVGSDIRRKYSAHTVDFARGRIELLVYLHGSGPGADWASRIRVGDGVRFSDFRGSQIVMTPGVHDAVFFGDETAIAAFAAIHRVSGGRVWIEGEEDIAAMLEAAEVPFTGVRRGSPPPLELARGIHATSRASIYIAGSAALVRDLRDILLNHGVDPARLRSKAFWGKPRREHALVA